MPDFGNVSIGRFHRNQTLLLFYPCLSECQSGYGLLDGQIIRLRVELVQQIPFFDRLVDVDMQGLQPPANSGGNMHDFCIHRASIGRGVGFVFPHDINAKGGRGSNTDNGNGHAKGAACGEGYFFHALRPKSQKPEQQCRYGAKRDIGEQTQAEHGVNVCGKEEHAQPHGHNNANNAA